MVTPQKCPLIDCKIYLSNQGGCAIDIHNLPSCGARLCPFGTDRCWRLVSITFVPSMNSAYNRYWKPVPEAFRVQNQSVEALSLWCTGRTICYKDSTTGLRTFRTPSIKDRGRRREVKPIYRSFHRILYPRSTASADKP